MVNTGGVYEDRNGGRHRWEVNRAHTLLWEGSAYLPAGVLLHLPATAGTQAQPVQGSGRDLPTTAPPAPASGMLATALDQLGAREIKDVCLVRPGGWLAGDEAADQTLIDALDARGFRYGIALDARTAAPLVGYLANPVRIDVPAEQRQPGRRPAWTVALRGARSAVYALVDLESDSVVAAGRVPVIDGRARIEAVFRPARRLFAPGAGRLLVVAERALDGPVHERPIDFWASWQDTRAELLQRLSSVKWGPGLRFFARPTASAPNLRGEVEDLLPSSGAFRLEFESWLERRYSVADLNLHWALNDRQVNSPTVAARLVPLWEREEQSVRSGWLVDPITHDCYRVDLRRCSFWRDFAQFRADSIRRAVNQTATLLKKRVADVPVIWQWMEYHPVFTDSAAAGGLDGLCFVPTGRGREAALTSAAFAYAQAEESARPTWFLQLGQRPDGSPPAASSEEHRLDWNWLREIGCKGFFADWGLRIADLGSGIKTGSPDKEDPSLPANPQSPIRNPQSLDWVRDYGAMLAATASAADYHPPVLFFPSTELGIGLTRRLDNGVWWLPSFSRGQRLSLGGDIEGYWIDRSPDPAPPGTGRGVLALWSTRGPSKATFAIPSDQPVAVYDSAGRTLKEASRRGRLQLSLDTTPVLVSGLPIQSLFPMETAAEALREFEVLIRQAEAHKLDVSAFKLALGQAKTVFTPSGAATAYQIIRTPLAMLRAALTPYIWLEGETASSHNWSGVQPEPRAAAGSYLRLERSSPPVGGTYQARFTVNIDREATYEIWLAGSVPGEEESSPFTWRIGNRAPALAAAGENSHRYAPGLGWTLLGQAQLSPGRHSLTLAVTEPSPAGLYQLTVDAVVLAREPFRPDGTRRPDRRFTSETHAAR